MKFFISIVILIALIFLQVSLLPHFEILHTIPSLIFIIAIAWCIAGNFKEAIFWGVAGGIILDLFSPFYFGTIALANLGIIMIVYFIMPNFINNDDKFSIVAVGVIATFIYNFLLIFLILISRLARLSAMIQPLNFQFILSVFIQAVLNTIILLLIYNFIKSIQSIKVYYEQRRQIKA